MPFRLYGREIKFQRMTFTTVNSVSVLYLREITKWKHFPRYWPVVRGTHRSLVNSLTNPVTQSFDVFFDLLLNNRLSIQWWGWLFAKPSRSSWRHCNAPTFKRPYMFHCYHQLLVFTVFPFIRSFVQSYFNHTSLDISHNSRRIKPLIRFTCPYLLQNYLKMSLQCVSSHEWSSSHVINKSRHVMI